MSLEYRIDLLTGANSSENAEGHPGETFHATRDVFAGVSAIAAYPVSLFVLDPEAILQQEHIELFCESSAAALSNTIPLLSVFTASPMETDICFTEMVSVLLALEALAQETIPYLTVLTETDTSELTSVLPVGEIVIAECAFQTDRPLRHHPPAAGPAPKEQRIPEKHYDLNVSTPDINIDAYIPRTTLRPVLTRFLKFFAATKDCTP